MEHHACDYCQLGPFCDCGRINTDDSTYNIYPVHSNQLRLFYEKLDDNTAVHRLNTQINNQEESWKADITSWTEWIATGRTLLLATLRRTKSALSLNNWIGR